MKVAILGYGINNKGAYEYYREKYGADVTIVDENPSLTNLPAGAETILGPEAFSSLGGFDIVLRTPPIRPERIKTNGKIWSATNEFFAQCPAPIIGVTGTKGKGTTSTLIAEILRAAGRKVHLVGNIGVAALSELSKIQPQDVVVYELSSFQLWDLEKSPQTAVVLMIEPDHLDVHASMEEYVQAKANISCYQKPDDLIVYHPSNEYSRQIAELSSARKKQYLTESGAYINQEEAGSWVMIDGQKVVPVDDIGLVGVHNHQNVCAAITAAWDYTRDIKAIASAVTSFTGLPHRLELVRVLDGIQYYDDSFSTMPAAAIAALASFEQPITVILGGSDKGSDLTELCSKLDSARHKLVIIGAVAAKIEAQCKQVGFTQYVSMGDSVTMPEIVQKARKLTPKGGVVLLSPAHASFGMFKSYYDRGDQFKTAVNAL